MCCLLHGLSCFVTVCHGCDVLKLFCHGLRCSAVLSCDWHVYHLSQVIGHFVMFDHGLSFVVFCVFVTFCHILKCVAMCPLFAMCCHCRKSCQFVMLLKKMLVWSMFLKRAAAFYTFGFAVEIIPRTTPKRHARRFAGIWGIMVVSTA